MHLMDFLPNVTTNFVAKFDEDDNVIFEKALACKKAGEDAVKLASLVSPYGENEEPTRKELQNLGNRFYKDWNSYRGKILKKTLDLPKSLLLESSKDLFSIAALSPKIPLSDIRSVADKLGFLILPFDYLTKKSYSKESYELCQAIENFNKVLNPYLNIYALAPISYYDVNLHIEAEHDKAIYASSMVSQAFMAVSLMMPMFRMMKSDLKKVQTAQVKMNLELKNLVIRIESLEEEVKRQQRIMFEKANSKSSDTDEIISRVIDRSEPEIISHDPVLLAIPTEIHDNTNAIIGPCWGPDFKDIVVKTLGFKKIAEQKELLTSSTMSWNV